MGEVFGHKLVVPARSFRVLSHDALELLIDYPGASTHRSWKRWDQMPDKEEWKRYARLGSYVMHSRYNAKEMTLPARQAAWRRFEDIVDKDRTLAPEDRYARAIAARHAHMLRIAMKSQAARRARKEAAASR